MGNEHLWVWSERRGRSTLLKVRGDLDLTTADQFARDSARELAAAEGPVAVDLSFLDFVDCAGARALAAAIASVEPWRLTEVRGPQPAVARLLDLIGVDLMSGRVELARALERQALLAQAGATRMQSRETLLAASATMARLAATCDELAAARQRRAEQEQARAARMQALSEAARDLSARCRQSAIVAAG